MTKYIIIFLSIFFIIRLNAFTISKDTIIVKKNSDATIDISAKELSFYIKKIINHKIHISNKIVKNTSNIILTYTNKKLLDDGFILKTNKNNLYILSNTYRGIIYGVYYFLKKYLGCRFLSKDYEYIPKYSQKSFKKIYKKEEPAFLYREIFISESDDLKFSFKSFLNGRLGHRIEFEKENSLHTFTINTHSFISSELVDTNYECNGQYDYNNPNMKKEALISIDKRLKQISKNRQTFAIIEHEDRGSTCNKNLNGKTPAEIFLNYSSYLAKNLQKKYPKVLFLHQAYFWSRAAPKSAKKLPKNLGVLFSPIEADFAKPLNSKENKKLWQDLLSWGKISNNIIIWHYFINFNSYLTPYPDLYAKWYDLKDFKKLGFIKGVFLQGSYGGYGGDLSDLRIWVFSKLLWNPNQNINKLIEEFCFYYYGKADKDVVKYIKTVQLFISKSKEKLYAKTPIGMKYLNNKNLKILSNILYNGLKKLKKDSIYYNHLLQVILGVDILKALQNEKFKDKKQIINFLISHPKIESFSESIKIENILNILKLKRDKEKLPKLVKDLKLIKGKDWLDFQEYQMELCCTKIVEDKDASDKIAAVMQGSSNEWGFSLNLVNIPKGSWDVYANVKITLNKTSFLDKAKWALKYGIEENINRGIRFIAQMKDGYNTLKIGSFNTKNPNAKYIWISPPANNIVKKLFIDRIFFIKKD